MASHIQGLAVANPPHPPSPPDAPMAPPWHPQSAADQIAANYRSLMAGSGPLPQNVVDRAAGY